MAQQQPLFDRITVEDGLPGRQVLALHQDHLGMVWIGTDNGLARYEGMRIRTWHHDRSDPRSLANEQVNSIDEDRDGTLWIGTANGLNSMDPARVAFRGHALPASDAERTRANRVDDVLCDVNGTVWASTEGGLFAVDPVTGHATRLIPSTDRHKGPPGTRVHKHAMVRDPVRQGIWLGTDEGLVFHHLPSGAWYSHRNDPQGWQCFSKAPAGTPMPLRDGTLLWFDLDALALVNDDLRGSTRVVDHLNGERTNFTPRFIAQDPGGTVWLSTWTYRLYRLNEDLSGALLIDDTPDLPGAMVEDGPYCTLMDRSGVRWFGTAQGVALLAPSRQGMTVMRPSKGAILLGAIAQHGDTLLVGTLESGLILLDLQHNSSITIPVTGTQDEVEQVWSRRTTSAVRWDEHTYLIGSAHGLLWLDLRTRTLVPAERHMAFPPRLATASITCMAMDAQDRLWVGTWVHGAYRMDRDGQAVQFHEQALVPGEQLPNNGVLDLLVARTGDVWLGLNDGGGLVRLPGGDGPAMHIRQGTEQDAIYAVVTALAEAPDGMIWAGTHQGGLDHYDPSSGQLAHWSRRNGLPSDRIGALVVDEGGDVWCITSAGLAHLPAGAARFVPVAPPQGISPLRFHSRTHLLPDRRLVTANTDQLLLLRTGDPDLHPPVPEVHVVEVRNGSGLLNFQRNEVLRLPFEQRTLVLEVAITGSTSPHGIQLRYRIPGLIEEETEMASTGRLDLIDLPAGTHRVFISASADGRNWSSTPAMLEVEVLPPFWATWWFRALLAIGIALITLTLVRLYVQQKLTAQRVDLERKQVLLAERMRIATDMHDDLGAGLSGLKLRSELAARVEQDPTKRAQLLQLAGMAGELIGNMRQLIWTMDGGQGSLEDLATYCANYARKYLSEHGIHCIVHQPEQWPHVQVGSEQRRDVFLVIKESLHNVVKHAGADTVELSLQWAHGELHLEVRDDGTGLAQDAANATRGVGLRSMHQRMARSGGRLTVGGANGERGTRVSGRLPIAGH